VPIVKQLINYIVYKQKSNKNEKQKGRSATQKLQKHNSMESTAQ